MPLQAKAKMNLSELRDAFRIRADDRAKPYLWSDEEIDFYLNEAESEAAQRALLIQDEAIEIAVDASGGVYDLNTSVLKIRRAKRSDGTVLILTSRDRLDAEWAGWETATGTPAFIIDNGDGTATAVPIPVVSDTITLSVYRLPLTSMVSDTDVPEIHSRYHYRMLDWALHLAYLKHDADAFDQAAADRHEAAFERSYGYMHTANAQRKQRDKRPPIVRTNW